MRVLVVGGTGFVGRHVVSELARRGWEGIAAGRSASGEARLDLSDREAARRFFRDKAFDAVVNTIGRIDQTTSISKYHELVADILLPSINLMEALWEHHDVPLIQIGSSAEYGNAATPHAPDTLGRPTTAYGAVKLAVTQMVQTKARAEQRRACIVRPFFVFGQGAPASNFLEILARAASAGGPFSTTEGRQTRDMISVQAVAQVVVESIALADREARIVNACSGVERTIRSVVELAARLSGGRMKPLFGALGYRPGEIMLSRGEPWHVMPEGEAHAQLSDYLTTRISELDAGFRWS